MITPLKDLIVEVKMKNKLLLLHKEIVKKRVIKNLILSWMEERKIIPTMFITYLTEESAEDLTKYLLENLNNVLTLKFKNKKDIYEN